MLKYDFSFFLQIIDYYFSLLVLAQVDGDIVLLWSDYYPPPFLWTSKKWNDAHIGFKVKSYNSVKIVAEVSFIYLSLNVTLSVVVFFINKLSYLKLNLSLHVDSTEKIKKINVQY